MLLSQTPNYSKLNKVQKIIVHKKIDKMVSMDTPWEDIEVIAEEVKDLLFCRESSSLRLTLQRSITIMKRITVSIQFTI